MICHRCSRSNNDDDHRCVKCAARLNNRRVASSFYTEGSLALQPQPEGAAVAVLDDPDTAPRFQRAPIHAAATQQSLFSRREAQRVVSIGGPEPERRRRRAPQRRKPLNASYLPQQGVLEFVPVATPEPRRLGTSVEARILCDRPVASLTHRIIACGYDLVCIAALVTVFFGIALWGCEGLTSAFDDRLATFALCSAVVLLGIIYECVFLVFRAETPGMRFAGLQLLAFNGREVTEEQMYRRIVGVFLNILPISLGLAWTLVDEETLTWQDLFSRTFLTPTADG